MRQPKTRRVVLKSTSIYPRDLGVWEGHNNCCDLSDIPPSQNIAQGRFMVGAAHELRLIRCRCKKSWPRRHPPFRMSQEPSNKLYPSSIELQGEAWAQDVIVCKHNCPVWRSSNAPQYKLLFWQLQAVRTVCDLYVLWHINRCRLSNAKFCLYIYIKYIWFVNTNVDNIFKWARAHFLRTQLNGFKYS